MNKRILWTASGIAALSVTLVALPGLAAQRPQISTFGPQSQSRNQDIEIENLGADEFEIQVEPGTLPGQEDMQVVTANGAGWLGVGVTEITTDKAKELKLPAERGALLGKIIPGSPAAKAGLKQNDVVTEINGERIEGTAQFRRMIREIPVGRTAQLTVWRDGKAQNIGVTVSKSAPRGEFPTTAVMPAGSLTFHMPDVQVLPEIGGFPEWMGSSAQPRLGVDAENLDGDFGSYFGAPDGEGVLIRNVFPNSAAAKAGLKAGDVIVSLNGERIRSVGELREKFVAGKDSKSAKLGLLRNHSELSVTVEIPAPAQHQEHRLSERTNI